MQKTIHFLATDGFSLTGSLFLPASEGKKVLLINSVVAVPQSYYAPFAMYMSQKGYIVYTYDYRGIGKSRNMERLKGFEANMQDWANKDLRGILSFIQENHPNSSLYILGHSFGGNCLGMNEKTLEMAEKIVMIGSQFGYYGYFWASKKPILFAFWHFKYFHKIKRTFLLLQSIDKQYFVLCLMSDVFCLITYYPSTQSFIWLFPLRADRNGRTTS